VTDELARICSHAIFSEQAALKLAQTDSPEAALKILAERYACFVGITLGERGCIWIDPDTRAVRSMRPPPVDALDTLAAGDVWHGAFALALAEARPIAWGVAFANAAAALKCQTFGGRLGAPSRADVERLMAERGEL
jgi:sugar/nucleoside kinase (ribokinase family)